MACEYCMKTPHDYRCPLYEPPKATYYCSYCNEGIYDGEEYIANQDGEYMHYECVQGLRQLLEWLGYEIKEMDDTYERY